MALSHPLTLVADGSECLVAEVAHTEVMATPESLIRLVKNILHPVRCEWEAGTKDECGIILGSWALLRKHLHTVHCQDTGDDFYCALPKCNQQFHPSYSTFIEHLDSAHLLCLTFCCPLPKCQGLSPLQGIQSLQKHFETHHNCNNEGKASPYSTDSDITTWMPIMWHQPLANRSTTTSAKPSWSGPSTTSHKTRSRLGAILVPSIRMKKSQKIVEWIQEGEEAWLPSQPTTMSQSQYSIGSQIGLHPMTKRRRQAKQLEKIKEIRRDGDEDEGVTKVVLDDLTRFDAERNLMGILVKGGGDGQGITVMGQRQEVLLKGLQQKGKSRDTKLVQKANDMMIIGQMMKQLMVGLSQPQPMLIQKSIQSGDGYSESARAPKSITFGVMQRKLDRLAALGVAEIDSDQLLHDPTL